MAYRPDRRIDAIRPLGAVTKNEAAQPSDLEREQTYERNRETIADDLRRRTSEPKRRFADLVKKR